MIPEDQLRPLIERLAEKSRTNHVFWRKIGAPSQSAYEVAIEDIRLQVLFEESRGRGEVRFWEGDRNIGIYSVQQDQSPASDFELVSELHQQARRCVVGWDNVVARIHKALEGDGLVGL